MNRTNRTSLFLPTRRLYVEMSPRVEAAATFASARIARVAADLIAPLIAPLEGHYLSLEAESRNDQSEWVLFATASNGERLYVTPYRHPAD